VSDHDHLRFGPDPLALDDVTAERLLRDLDAEDAPPPYGPAAALLSALRSAARPSELAAEDAVLVAMAAGLALADPPESPRRTTMLKKFLSTRFAAAAAIGVLSMGGVAAAASGSVQTALANAVSPLADVVTGDGSTTSTTVADTTSTTVTGTTDTTVADTTSTTVASTTVTTDTTVAGSTDPALTPEQQAACDAATNHGEYVSSVARDHSVTGVDHGQAVSEAAHSDCGKHADGTTDTTISGTTDTSSDAQDQTEVEQPDTQDAAKATKPAAQSSGKSHGHGQSGQHGKK
jgi:hypothetical protein